MYGREQVRISKEFTSTLRNRNVNVKKDSSQCEYGSIVKPGKQLTKFSDKSIFQVDIYFHCQSDCKFFLNILLLIEVEFILCSKKTLSLLVALNFKSQPLFQAGFRSHLEKPEYEYTRIFYSLNSALDYSGAVQNLSTG